MGCHVIKQQNDDKKFKEFVITDEMLQECKIDDDVKSRISVYNQAINKKQQVPKLRQAIFNPIVQRRKMQQQDEHE